MAYWPFSGAFAVSFRESFPVILMCPTVPWASQLFFNSSSPVTIDVSWLVVSKASVDDKPKTHVFKQTCCEKNGFFTQIQGNDDMPFACRKLMETDGCFGPDFVQRIFSGKHLREKHHQPEASLIMQCSVMWQNKLKTYIYIIYTYTSQHTQTHNYIQFKNDRNQQSSRMLWCKRPSQPSLK